MIQVLLGYLIDLIVGDPQSFPHPVRWIGQLIARLEKWLYPLLKSPGGQRLTGAVLALTTVAAVFSLAWGTLWLAALIHPFLRSVLEVVMVWWVLATSSLGSEAEKVRNLLRNRNLPGARRQLAMLVSRDTKTLDAGGVARAAVETVAENFSDGVAAPLFFLIVGGPAVAMAYKAVNTLDSMVGYKNDRYLYFGWFSARLDDWVNWIPARLSVIFVWIGAAFMHLDWRSSIRITLRDRLNHGSPNSGYPESAFAGALAIQMGGPSSYFGIISQKPTIGDPLVPIEHSTIKQAYGLMYMASLVALVLMGAVRLLIA